MAMQMGRVALCRPRCLCVSLGDVAGWRQADFLEIWTDVHGLYTCDPRVIPEVSESERERKHACHRGCLVCMRVPGVHEGAWCA